MLIDRAGTHLPRVSTKGFFKQKFVVSFYPFRRPVYTDCKRELLELVFVIIFSAFLVVKWAIIDRQ